MRSTRSLGSVCGVTAFAVALAFVAVPEAFAADGKPYVGLNVPLMFIDDTESTTGGTMMTPGGAVPYTARAETKHKTGFKLAGVVGYEFGNGLRVEGELFLARAGVDKLTYSGPAAGGTAIPIGAIDVPVSGTAGQLGVLANVWYDVDTGSDWVPFVGGGVGLMRVDYGNVEYDGNALAQTIADVQARAAGQPSQPLPPGFVPALSTTDTVFAWHIGAGVGYRLNDNIILQAGYRLQAAGAAEFEGRNSFGSAHSETDMRVHFLEIGLRYRF